MTTTASPTSAAPLILAHYETPAGTAHAVITPEDGAVRLFGWLEEEPNIARLPAALRERGLTEGDGPAGVRDAVDRYGQGELDALGSIDVAQEGGEFFQAAWAAMREVGAGHPVTYTELATAAWPSAVRAAASACARNHVALIVPCHRIVRRDGGLGGFFYGLEIKRALQAHEARFAN